MATVPDAATKATGRGWFKTPKALVDDGWLQTLTHSELKLVVAVLYFENFGADAMCFASPERIGALVGMDVRHVKRAIASLSPSRAGHQRPKRSLGILRTIDADGGRNNLAKRRIVLPAKTVAKSATDSDTQTVANLVPKQWHPRAANSGESGPQTVAKSATRLKTEDLNEEKKTTSSRPVDGDDERVSLREELRRVGLRGKKLNDIYRHSRLCAWMIRAAIIQTYAAQEREPITNPAGWFVSAIEALLEDGREGSRIIWDCIGPDKLCNYGLAHKKDGKYYLDPLPANVWGAA